MIGNNKSMIKRIVTAVLLFAVLVTVLTGCAEIKITHPLSESTLLEINDVECSMGTAVLRLLEAREEYSSDGGEVLWIRTVGNTTLAEYVKNAVADDLLKYTAAQVMATDLTVFLTEVERTQARKNGEALYERLGRIYDLPAYDISLSDATDLFMKRAYYNKVYDKLSENIYMEISEADTKAILVSYVLVPREDGIETAERFRNEAKSGKDFADVCAEFGYYPELRKVITKGMMPTAFENYAYALKDNEISEIVETQEGFYIIDCLEDYMVSESLANNNMMVSNAKRDKFNDAYAEFASVSKMRFNTEGWEKYDISIME